MQASDKLRWILAPAFAILALEARAQTALIQGGVTEGLANGMRVGAIVPGDRWHALKPERLRLALGRTPGGGVTVWAGLSF